MEPSNRAARPGSRPAGSLPAVLALLAGLWLTGAAVPSAYGQEAWEYSPYRIQVWLACAAEPQLPPAMQAEITRTVELRSDAVVEGPWRLQIAPAPVRLGHDINHALGQITYYELTGLPREEELSKDGADRDAGTNPGDSGTNSGDQSPAAADDDTEGPESADAGKEEGDAAEPQAVEGQRLLEEFDKVYLLGVDYELGHFVLRVREFDCGTRMWGRQVERRVRQRPLVPETAFDALLAAFTPVVRIEDAEDKRAVTRLRAANLTADPAAVTAIRAGDLLQPVIRRNDRYGEPLAEGIEVIPWTFLSVEQEDGSILNCQIHSGLRRPISGRSSVRTQRFGMLVRPMHESTRLVLMSEGENSKPLSGYDVYSKYPEPLPDEPAETGGESASAGESGDSAAAATEQAGAATDAAEQAGGQPAEDSSTGASSADGEAAAEDEPDAADSEDAAAQGQAGGSSSGEAGGQDAAGDAEDDDKDNPPVLLGRSDWRGMVDVPPGDHPIRLVYVKNGNRLLARLPIVPGLEATQTVELMNDDLRLQAEAFIAGVRNKIMDVVTRRAVLAARIRARIEENKIAEAEELMTEFRSLETRRDLSGLLDQEAQRFIAQDRVTQRKIDILFSDTRELLAKYIKPEENDQLSQLIRQRQSSGG